MIGLFIMMNVVQIFVTKGPSRQADGKATAPQQYRRYGKVLPTPSAAPRDRL